NEEDMNIAQEDETIEKEKENEQKEEEKENEQKEEEQEIVKQDEGAQNIQSTGVQSTAAEVIDLQGTVEQGTSSRIIDEREVTAAGPSIMNYEDEAGPSTFIPEEEREHTASDDETIAQVIMNLRRPTGGIHISEPAQKR
ncbi:MAG: hypothetical protein J6586_10135, partial [Snodgrassella sp.]|nr:hypothetical protein [Snodgrassella sp.]